MSIYTVLTAGPCRGKSWWWLWIECFLWSLLGIRYTVWPRAKVHYSTLWAHSLQQQQQQQHKYKYNVNKTTGYRRWREWGEERKEERINEEQKKKNEKREKKANALYHTLLTHLSSIKKKKKMEKEESREEKGKTMTTNWVMVFYSNAQPKTKIHTKTTTTTSIKQIQS